MFTTDRTKIRQFFVDAWTKYQNSQPLEPLEQQLVDIFLQHPEYHPLLESADALFQEQEGINPFLHLSLHQAVLEQVSTDRPYGITAIYKKLIEHHTPHDADHLIMEVLAAEIWEATHHHQAFNEADYLKKLQKIVTTRR